MEIRPSDINEAEYDIRLESPDEALTIQIAARASMLDDAYELGTPDSMMALVANWAGEVATRSLFDAAKEDPESGRPFVIPGLGVQAMQHLRDGVASIANPHYIKKEIEHIHQKSSALLSTDIETLVTAHQTANDDVLPTFEELDLK